jgi:hypothetical protein
MALIHAARSQATTHVRQARLPVVSLHRLFSLLLLSAGAAATGLAVALFIDASPTIFDVLGALVILGVVVLLGGAGAWHAHFIWPEELQRLERASPVPEEDSGQEMWRMVALTFGLIVVLVLAAVAEHLVRITVQAGGALDSATLLAGLFTAIGCRELALARQIRAVELTGHRTYYRIGKSAALGYIEETQ